MNATRVGHVQGGAAFETRRISRRWRQWFISLFLSAASLIPVRAETLYTLSGWIEPAARPYSGYGEYVLLNDPLDRVRAILVADPDHRFVKDLPARCKVQAAITQPRGPGDEPVFRIVSQEIVASASSSPDATGNPGWTALTTDLYDARMNVVPRITSLMGDEGLDADGDGVPDSRDEFPGRPEEWSDNDNDGTGNNADPDDDNDGMSDSYEILNGLNPLLADAGADADGDGASNGDEAAAGTRANDRNSVFVLTCSLDAVNDRITVQWQALATRVYSVDSAPSPGGPWLPILSGFRPSRDDDFSFSFPSPATSPVFLRATASTP